MTVDELIKELQKFPQDANVYYVSQRQGSTQSRKTSPVIEVLQTNEKIVYVN